MAEKMWAGRFAAAESKIAEEFNSSIAVDARMYREDIEGSMAHAAMLGAKQIISASDSALIIKTLGEILDDLDSGKIKPDESAEDIHMYVEAELTARIGEVGKRLHTARSRNDQVAVDLRLYLRRAVGEIRALLRENVEVLTKLADAHKQTIMPGYTHLQRAQPITFGHHLMAYVMMLIRDDGRLCDAVKRMNRSPLGACALAGTTYDTDREMTAKALGFDAPMLNSLDAVSDRDHCVELASAFAVLCMHLSRLAEEILLWSSSEFDFIELSDAFTTGSSIMPQKKNSDMAELIRGKTGRVYGNLIATLTMLKGLPLAYNKDMQEDKEAIFDSVDTVKMCLSVLAPMLDSMEVHPDVMYRAAQGGFINATDLADYLTKRGMPFRAAYKTVGQIVAYAIEHHVVLDEIPLETYQGYSELFCEDLYGEIKLETCVEKRKSLGGTSAAAFAAEYAYATDFLRGQGK
ncbi:MAG: argininosuccinate lyase [Clostridia bacterium]|nr:argininosuccinate lyase [Clostridia bacterium]